MRTTIDIPDDLFVRLREQASKESTTIDKLLAEGAAERLRMTFDSSKPKPGDLPTVGQPGDWHDPRLDDPSMIRRLAYDWGDE